MGEIRRLAKLGMNSSRRTFLATAFGGCVATLAPTGAAVQFTTKRSKMLRWRTHSVAEIPHGYQVAVADINGDGRPDILALSSVESVVEWYANSTWEAHPITRQTRKNISLAPLFRPGYPARGLALATDFALEDSRNGGDVWWAEPPLSGDSEWTLHFVGRIPTSHRLHWADLDGDGRLELVNAPLLGYGAEAPEYQVGAPLTWYEMPETLLEGHAAAGAARESAWTPHIIDDSLTVVHGIHVMDWDADGRDEILTASFEGVHLFQSTGQGNGLRWTKVRLAEGDQVSRPRWGSSEIAVGKVHGRRFLATIEPWHGERVVVYFAGSRNELWSRHVIDNSFREGHALAVADLDGDGNDEIVAGFRGEGTSLYVYYAADSAGAQWDRQTLDDQIGGLGRSHCRRQRRRPGRHRRHRGFHR